MIDVELDFERLYPLVDDTMRLVGELDCGAFGRAAVASMLLSRMIAKATDYLIASLLSGEHVDQETSMRVAGIVNEHSENANIRFSSVYDIQSETKQ